MLLKAANTIDTDIEGHYAFFPIVEQLSTRKHRHDFYEIFIVVNGSILHHVNETTVDLSSGTLVLIRPNDAHYFSKHADHNCELINLAFLAATFDALAAYLDLPGRLAPQPPTVHLSKSEKALLVAQLEQWGRSMYQEKARSRLALRSLLAQVVPFFFLPRYDLHRPDTPTWLRDVCQQMQQPDHLIEGREALMRLANRSPEHVGRAFKTYLNVTPSEFINNLRLDYATDLLLHTDQPVTDICFEVGFGNLSHFYHLFKDRWNCSPKQYRDMYRRSLIP